MCMKYNGSRSGVNPTKVTEEEKKDTMRCVGYGIYEGKCKNEAGTPWTPYWCKRCDDLRKETITKSLEEISKGFENKKNAKRI